MSRCIPCLYICNLSNLTKFLEHPCLVVKAETCFFPNLFCFRQEQNCYYAHREKARSDPEKYLTIILDGMDQNKTNLPYLVRLPKSLQNLQRLRTHLTGALVHTRSPHGKIVYAFFDFLQWPYDSNLNIQVLLEILLDFKEKLPPTLYLQLDNSARENKNRFFFSFCAILVKRKVFKKVCLIKNDSSLR